MKKRLFAIMLALAMLLAAVPALAEEVAVEQDNTAGNKICATDGCKNSVANEGEICTACATAKKVAEEAAKKAAEEEAAKKAEEEAAAKKAEEEAAKRVAEEAAKKAAEEAAKKAAEKEVAKESPINLAETNPADPGTTNGCNHKHTPKYNNGTMVWYAPTEPTCAKEGNIGYYQCNKCGKYFKKDGSNNINEKPAIEINLGDTVIPKTNVHTLGEKVTEKAATCTAAGNIGYYECSVCKGKFKDEKGENPVNDVVIPALGHDYEYLWGTWDCKTKTITAYRKCKRAGCTVVENPTTISVSEKDRDTWYSCGKKYTTVYYKVVANYGNETVEYEGKAECTYSTSDYCRPGWYYDPCYYNNPCGHWGCGNVCTRYSDCVPCQNYRTTFRVGGYNCLATPKTGDVSVIGMALISLVGAGAAIMGKKRK